MVRYDETLGLRTANAVSKAITSGQAAGSILMFGGIYALLLAVWILVLNDKIRKGPEPLPAHVLPVGTAGVLSTVRVRVDHGDSLTASDTPPPGGGEGEG